MTAQVSIGENQSVSVTCGSGDESSDGPTEEIVITLAGRRHRPEYKAGETILDTARRAGLEPPFSCEGGECGTCMALLTDGHVTMACNTALMPDELEEGWILTCQGRPTSKRVVVEYPD